MLLVQISDLHLDGSAERRERAARTMAYVNGLRDVAADRPALVCFHHPPVVLHSPLLDAIRLTNPDRLAAVLADHPQVLAVLCGHAHTAATSTFAGRPVVVAPGVVSTLRLPPEHADSLDYELPPGVALHFLAGTRLTTHVRVLP